MRLELGKQVRAADGEAVGELADIIIDPTERRVTHLVVKPHDGDGGLHLVPIELAVSDDDGHDISLRCDAEEVRKLPNVQDFAYIRLGEVPVSDPEWDIGTTDVLAPPYYESGMGGYAGAWDDRVGVVYDRIPKGEVEIRRASSVFSSDGHHVGDVDGFLVDEGHITHFVLERGHLWGRREVTIPINLVARVESDAVTVSLTKDEIGDLPAHKVHRWSLHRDAKS
jgi:sporulation protein YlmC with PRC-barrel domain